MYEEETSSVANRVPRGGQESSCLGVEVAESWPGFGNGCANGTFQGSVHVGHAQFPSCSMTASDSEPNSCSRVVIHASLAAG